jgi:CRP/FNR family cyclic AMP-dependent transcriptional regulator
MGSNITMELLRAHPFVRGMADDQLGQLGAIAKQARFERDRILFGEGEEGTDFYLIVSGSVSLEIAPPGGVCRVDTLGPGDELGWSSVMGSDTVFQGRVLQELHVLAFDAAGLRRLCEEDTAFGYEFMRRLLGVVADRLQATRLLVMDSFWPVAKRAGA